MNNIINIFLEGEFLRVAGYKQYIEQLNISESEALKIMKEKEIDKRLLEVAKEYCDCLLKLSKEKSN